MKDLYEVKTTSTELYTHDFTNNHVITLLWDFQMNHFFLTDLEQLW